MDADDESVLTAHVRVSIPCFCIPGIRFELLARIPKANSMAIQTILFELWPLQYIGCFGIELYSIPAKEGGLCKALMFLSLVSSVSHTKRQFDSTRKTSSALRYFTREYVYE
jgi:hypothetical protein